jgi:hypothetical protein
VGGGVGGLVGGVGGGGVLVGLCVVRGEREIARLAGRTELLSESRSLYPYFFVSRDEELIELRLRALG